MNLPDDILYVNFNQDSSSLSVGTKRGYQLYTVSANDDFVKLYENTQTEDVFIIERLFSSSLITYVTLNAPRKLQVSHFQKQQEICSQSYPNSILAIRLNRTRLVVCLEESLYIHNIRDMKVLHMIRDTPPNPAGICELCASEVSYLAYPGSVQNGEVQIFDACNLQAVTMLTAHSGRIAALKFNADGSKLATASEKGTIIKVFQIPGGEKLFEFRRGMKRCADIYSLAFSSPSYEPSFLCCSSSTETVHVFKLEHKDDHHYYHNRRDSIGAGSQADSCEESSGMQSWVNYVSKTAASYLPAPVSDMLQQGRAFAQARLPRAGARNACALSASSSNRFYNQPQALGKQLHNSSDDRRQRRLRLLVASLDGNTYAYDVDVEDGGECSLVKQTHIVVGDGCGVAVGATPATATASATQSRSEANATESHAAATSARLDSLNLDDEKEFPPMAHTSG